MSVSRAQAAAYKLKIGGWVAAYSLFALVLVVLKLTGVVGWSWWWVLAPLMAPWAAVGVLLMTGLLLVGLIVGGKFLVDLPLAVLRSLAKSLHD